MWGMTGLSEVIEAKRGKRGEEEGIFFFRLDESQGVWGFRGIVGRSPVQGAATRVATRVYPW